MTGSTSVDCTYIIASEEFPFVPEATSTLELISEFGILGMFIDPLITQVPEQVSVLTATFDDGAGARPFLITTTDSFFAQPGTEITAAPGQKFLIIEFPDDVPDTLPSGDPRSVLRSS